MKDSYGDLLGTADFKQNENDAFSNYLIDSIPGGISVCQGIDGKLKTLSFTAGVPLLLGYTEEEYRAIIEDDTLVTVFPRDRRKILKTLAEVTEEKVGRSSSIRCYCKNGTLTWLHMSAKIMGKKDGIPLWHVIFVGMSDESLLYYDIVRRSTNGVYVIEKESFKLLYTNNAMEEILAGFGLTDFLGKKCHRVLRNREQPCENCFACSSKNPGEPQELYLDFLSKYYSAVSHPIRWRGVPAYVIYLSDISQEKEATDEITQIYNNIPGAVLRCKFDADWTVLSANDGYFEFLGYTREEFAAMGNKAAAVIYPKDLPGIFPAISAQLLMGKAAVEHQQRFICKNGDIKWAFIRSQLLESKEEGKFFYCVLVDITAQKNAQAELKKTQMKLSAAIEHAGLDYWEYDLENNRAYLNDASTNEYNLDQLIENYPESVYQSGAIHPDSIPRFDELVQAVRRGEPSAKADIKTLDAKGALVWKRVRFTTLFDDSNKPFWAVATAENIDDYKELENRFTTVLEQNHIDTWLYDLSRRTIIQNHKTEDVYGIPGTEIPNVPESLIASKQCRQEDVEKFRVFYKRLHEGEKQVTTTVRLWDARTETYVWKRCTYTLLPNRDGSLSFALGSAVDVTDQMEVKRKYEEALKHRYSNLGENIILAGHCNVSRNLILEVEDKTGLELERRFGTVREDFFKGLASLIPDSEQRSAFCKAFLNENIKNSFELGITQHDVDCAVNLGEEKGMRWVSVHVDTALQPETGELVGFLTVRDVSASKMQEQVLDAVIQFDYDFVAHLSLYSNTTVFYNSKSQSEQLRDYKYGVAYSYTDAVSRTAERYIVEEDRALYEESMSIKNLLEQMKEKNSYEFIYHLREENGEIRTKQTRFAVHNRAAGIVVFCRADVTEVLAQQEKQKIALSESLAIARQANSSKSKFLSSMSHDIRTPMNAIVGMCNLAIEDESNTRQVHESLKVIKQSSALLLSMITDILDMNRIESGKMVLTDEAFSFSEQLELAAERAKALASKKHQSVELRVDISHDSCCGDVVRIHRIIDNILANALKFTPEGGKITYSLSETPLEHKQISLYRFEISDTGIGISKEQQKHIFEPFYRVENSMTSQVEGTGLGLPIVKSIVDNMGGTISVNSALNAGTTFTIELPLRFAEEANREKEEEKPSGRALDLSNVHVLLCEDHPMNQLVATRILEKVGAQVTIAEDGKAGLELFSKSPPNSFDVILMDIQMPLMNGYEASRAIRACSQPQAKTIPIIAMTANAFAEDVQKSIDAGMNDHLTKPIEPKELYDTLAKYLP
ncbi:MAG: PAS domain-containing protein [Oscillospiraceae bacterium]